MTFDPSDFILGIKKLSLLIFGTVLPLKDSNNRSTNILRNNCGHIYNLVLDKNTQQLIDIPTNTKYFFIDHNSKRSNPGNVYTKLSNLGTIATIPASNILDGYGSMLNIPGYIIMNGETKLSLIADQDTIISISFYS